MLRRNKSFIKMNLLWTMRLLRHLDGNRLSVRGMAWFWLTSRGRQWPCRHLCLSWTLARASYSALVWLSISWWPPRVSLRERWLRVTSLWFKLCSCSLLDHYSIWARFSEKLINQVLMLKIYSICSSNSRLSKRRKMQSILSTKMV